MLGVEVAFFTYGDKRDLSYKERLPGIRIIPAYADMRKYKNNKIAFLQSLFLPIKFRKEISRYDILKTNQMWGAWVPLIARWLLGRKLLVRCGFEHYYTLLLEKSSAITKCWFYLFSKLVYLSASHILLTSKHIASFVVDTFDVAPQKISIFPNLIDTELFNLKEKNDIYNNRIVFVGRLNIQKNLFSLIEASKKAGVGLDLVGFGELKTELQNFSKHINADVRHLGTCSNSQLPFLLASYPIFILPSFYEGNPKALLEAMSCGKAVIGTDVAGIREIIKDGENGILCDIHSDSIASAICRLVNDSHLRKRLGDNARRYIIENCYVNKIRDAEMNIYRNITKEKI